MWAIGGGMGILYRDDLIVEAGSRPERGVDAEIGGAATDHQAADAERMEQGLQAGPVEGVTGRFSDQLVVGLPMQLRQ